MLVRDALTNGYKGTEEVDDTSSDALDFLLNLGAIKEVYNQAFSKDLTQKTLEDLVQTLEASNYFEDGEKKKLTIGKVKQVITENFG